MRYSGSMTKRGAKDDAFAPRFLFQRVISVIVLIDHLSVQVFVLASFLYPTQLGIDSDRRKYFLQLFFWKGKVKRGALFLFARKSCLIFFCLH